MNLEERAALSGLLDLDDLNSIQLDDSCRDHISPSVPKGSHTKFYSQRTNSAIFDFPFEFLRQLEPGVDLLGIVAVSGLELFVLLSLSVEDRLLDGQVLEILNAFIFNYVCLCLLGLLLGST